ncbi:MAG: hypothetical protein NT067_05145 [Candidatus Diapherotrites archaeon]|nr:hypothetical protein [Candidatus Diapherotrites archaeon]
MQGEPAPYFRYGLNRVLLEWNPKGITGETCFLPYKDGNSGYFCDAAQFALFFQDEYSAFKQKVKDFVSNLSGGQAAEMDLARVRDLSQLKEKTGLSADFEALLLADNYSAQFKKDFDSRYTHLFFGKSRPSIAPLEFINSPKEPGLYKVSLEAKVFFSEGQFEFVENVSISFKLLKSLGELDLEQKTEMQKNPFLRLQFDAGLGQENRDYGTSIDGDEVWLNKDNAFSGLSGGIAGIESYSGESFDETASGTGLSFESTDGKTYTLQLNKSIPVALVLDFPAEKTQRLYYTLSSQAGTKLSSLFFGQKQSLFEWRSGEIREPDYFAMLFPKKIKCTGWDDEMLAGLVEFSPEEHDEELIHSVSFIPEDTAFSLQCVSDETTVTMLSYDGSLFNYRKAIAGSPGQWLVGKENLLQPKSWDGEFSLAGFIRDLNKGLMNVVEKDGVFSLDWNRAAFEELVKKAGLLEPGSGTAIQGPTQGPEKAQIEIPKWISPLPTAASTPAKTPQPTLTPEPVETPEAAKTPAPVATPSTAKEKVENYAIRTEMDADKDGIPDLKDKCPLEKETFNGFNDLDGCPDTVQQAPQPKTLQNPVPSSTENKVSISGKKVILFVPLGFRESENSKFKQLAKERFDSFMAMAGLDEGRDNISFLAMDVADIAGLKNCASAQPVGKNFEDGQHLGFPSTSIAFVELGACGNAYLGKKYGPDAGIAGLRVVGLLNSYRRMWYSGIVYDFFAEGLNEISRSGTSGLVLADLWSGATEHELGHTFGLEDQYSAKAYLEHVKYLGKVPKNFYPGPLQEHFNLESAGAGILYSEYHKGTSDYPKCSDEPGQTSCPEVIPNAPSSQIDCLGRKIGKTGGLQKRSIMGLLREDIGREFDCYEKKEIQTQWGGTE